MNHEKRRRLQVWRGSRSERFPQGVTAKDAKSAKSAKEALDTKITKDTEATKEGLSGSGADGRCTASVLLVSVSFVVFVLKLEVLRWREG